jgi:ATP-dependent DNA helicase RecQ
VAQFRFTADHQQVYEFQIANARFDPIIKALLRLYGGELYTIAVNINESRIARLLKLEPAKVSMMLASLQDQGLGTYQPKKEQPQVLFTTPRQDPGKLFFDVRSYRQRKEMELGKLKSMYGYVMNQRVCRSLQLLEYLDEISDRKCGICDVCRDPLPWPDYRSIEQEIKYELTRSPQTLIGLSRNLNRHPARYVAETVQQLLDRGVIIYDKLERLSLVDISA